MKTLLLFSATMLLVTVSFAQVNGDYRSLSIGGSWNNIAIWERYNGTAWVAPTAPQGYPGEFAGNALTVTIQNGTADVDITATVPNAIGSLVIGQVGPPDFAGLDFNAAGGASLTVTGDLSIVNGDLFINQLTGANVHTLTIGGNLTVSAPQTEALDMYENDDVGNIIFNGTNQTISGTGDKILNNVTFSNTGTVTISNSITEIRGVMTVGAGSIISPAATAEINSALIGTASLTGTGTIIVRKITAPASLTGQYRFIPGNINVSGMTVNFAGTSDQDINSDIGNYGAITTSGNGNRTALGPLTVTGPFTVISGVTFVPGTFLIQLRNNFTVNGSITPGTSEIRFNGSTAQTASGTGLSFYNATVANAAGVTFTGSSTISNTLTLTTGILALAPGTTTTISSGLPIAGGSFGATKHVNTQVNTGTGAQGFLRVSNLPASGIYRFETGNGTYYLPVQLTPSASSDFSVNVFTGVTTTGAPNGTPFNTAQKSAIVDAVWVVNRTSGGPTDLRVEWPQALEGTAFSGLTDTQIGIARYSGGWEVAAGSGSQASNFAQRLAVNAFSPFGVGIVGAVLPVNLSNVKAYEKNNGIQVEWSNLTEKDVLTYSVERSSNGTQFSSISQLNARSNQEAKEDYAVFDANPLQGTNFYRIRVNEISGKVVYSNVLRVDGNTGKLGVSVYPNPVRDGQLTIRLNVLTRGMFNVRLFNSMGQQVYQFTINNPGSGITETLTLPATLKAGRYTIQVSDGNFNESKAIILQ